MDCNWKWEISGRFDGGKPAEYREAKSGAKVWLLSRRWVSSPFGMMLRGQKGGIRLFASAEAAMREAEAEIAALTSERSDYFQVSRSAA